MFSLGDLCTPSGYRTFGDENTRLKIIAVLAPTNFRHTECVSVETGTRFSNFLLVSSFDIQLSRVLRQAARLQEGSIAQDFAVLAPTNLRHTECVSVETGTRFTIFPLAYFVSWNCCESIEGSRVLSAVFGVDSVIGKHI